jgi:hypothetical protein
MSAEENQKLEDEEEYEDEDEEMYEEDEDEDDEDDDQVDFLGNLLANTLATPEGDTLCGTLVKISDTLETQNKIMIKLLTLLSKRAA